MGKIINMISICRWRNLSTNSVTELIYARKQIMSNDRHLHSDPDCKQYLKACPIHKKNPVSIFVMTSYSS